MIPGASIYKNIIFRYRFRRDSVDYIVDQVRDELDPVRTTNHAFDARTKVLLTLRVLATGGFQFLCGNAEGMSQPSVHRHFNATIDALANLLPRYVNFPTDAQSLRNVSKGFYSFAGFPNVVGCVDGTQIPIFRPNERPEQYVNRKGFHSINVQVLKIIK